jgi:hypothetical protein
MERRLRPPLNAIADLNAHVALRGRIRDFAIGLRGRVVGPGAREWLRVVVEIVHMNYMCVDSPRQRMARAGEFAANAKKDDCNASSNK